MLSVFGVAVRGVGTDGAAVRGAGTFSGAGADNTTATTTTTAMSPTAMTMASKRCFIAIRDPAAPPGASTPSPLERYVSASAQQRVLGLRVLLLLVLSIRTTPCNYHINMIMVGLWSLPVSFSSAMPISTPAMLTPFWLRSNHKVRAGAHRTHSSPCPWHRKHFAIGTGHAKVMSNRHGRIPNMDIGMSSVQAIRERVASSRSSLSLEQGS